MFPYTLQQSYKLKFHTGNWPTCTLITFNERFVKSGSSMFQKMQLLS